MERVGKGSSEDGVEILGEIEADPEPNQHSDRRPQQTTTQFLEVLKKRHLSARRFLLLGTGSEAYHGQVPDCRSHLRRRVGLGVWLDLSFRIVCVTLQSWMFRWAVGSPTLLGPL